MANDTTSTTRRVAIIGAGFSGLTMANYLRRHEHSYHLFESKSEPIPIIGKIRLSHATKVLQALGLQQLQVLPEHEHDNSMHRLRQHVTIHYSCRVVNVKQQESTTTNSNQQLYYLMTAPNGNNSSTETSITTQYGPFDIVVAADGLFGNSISFDTTTTAGVVVIVIGDARWQFDTWWLDFGQRRIQRGEDIAICDAMELGQRLVAPGDWPELDNTFSNKKRQSQQLRRTKLRMIMVSYSNV
jgi:hypothetical protein